MSECLLCYFSTRQLVMAPESYVYLVFTVVSLRSQHISSFRNLSIHTYMCGSQWGKVERHLRSISRRHGSYVYSSGHQFKNGGSHVCRSLLIYIVQSKLLPEIFQLNSCTFYHTLHTTTLCSNVHVCRSSFD